MRIGEGSRWGLNFAATACEACGQPLSHRPRVPRTLRQLLWGGWTCPVCGADLDKWGHRRRP